ncbi:DUF1049 domain-containing protein [Serinibacter arcticus]|uniref:DUF1049 domain-containing protein n=1 Tax=Serinibacter arcticus TaxID=1655435 RepID=A0A2U1ZZ44_9MICO|nr:DUF1049 domain-containing protein [Serinibacter arcticus]PWD52220.1 DUF1049 domain-containing protein [Serinibacter arcticus]
MTQTPPPAPTRSGFGALAKKYWLPVLLTALAVVFIVQNTNDIAIHLFNRTVAAPAWLVYTILVVLGIAVGAFAQRRRIKRRVGLG